MQGDERVRFCSLCQKNVYNISAMTPWQAESFLRRNTTGICTKIYRRADGTVLTEDCPVGLVAIRRRVARVAGAAFSTLLSLGTAVAQEPRSAAEPATSLVQIGGEASASGSISGVVTDTFGSAIPRAFVALINQKTGLEFQFQSDGTGAFEFTSLSRGVYTVKIRATGFRTFQRSDLILGIQNQARVDARLEVGSMGGPMFVNMEPTALLQPGAENKPRKSRFGWLRKK
jgi:hypothetical protein